MIFLTVLLNIVLPVFVIIGLGFVAGRWLSISPLPFSRLTLYFLGPCLIFSSLAETTLTGEDLWRIVSFTLLTTFAVGLLSWVISKILRFDQAMESAFLLSTLFVNAGNYGLSVNFFAFGQVGLERALIFFVTSALLTNSLAVYLASRGKAEVIESLRNVIRMPLLYAALLALLINQTNSVVPEAVFKPIQMVGKAAIPVLLLALGMQLSRASFDRETAIIGLATAIRLGGAAGIALLAAALLNLEGVTRQACIIEASMPTAVTTTVLAMEFDAKPDFVTAVVFTSTLASIVTLTALLSLIM